ncbi:mechanosensory protein 2 [Clonorchis sinensis]|uniref:Mechanosensory protein 2 n=1 Tax=Clonorchis sinensis TaxID=79923 RepID=H2KTG8_CLOSI|nr:mechanosensory protein 2 [Clonorchis sinensis]
MTDSFQAAASGNRRLSQNSQDRKTPITTNRVSEPRQSEDIHLESTCARGSKARTHSDNGSEENSPPGYENDDVQNYEDVVTLHVPPKETIWLNTTSRQSRFRRWINGLRKPRIKFNDPVEVNSVRDSGRPLYGSEPDQRTTDNVCMQQTNPLNGSAQSDNYWNQNETDKPPSDSEKDQMVWTTNFLAALSIFLIVVTFPFSLIYCIRIVAEYERAVVLRMGNLIPKGRGTKGPGLFFILPCIDSVRKVDLRTVTFAIPPQELLTRDSVTVSVDAVVYYRVLNPVASVLNIEDAARSTRLLAQTTIRNVLGTKDLAQILMDRDEISTAMQSSLDATTDAWGVKVERVEIKDVRLPLQLQRAMAAEAEAAREARAKVIAAVGEQEAARSLKKAARIIATSPMAFQLRYLQTLCAISAEKNSTIFFPVPIDIMQNLGNFTMSSIGSGFPDLRSVPKHASSHTTTTRDTVVDVDSKLLARTIMETSFGQEETDAHSDTV